ncbi:hypothetical protein FRB91_007749 [Serendipita sp. 411]|nr:hypothetical protein FRB91_007749 [Serendipita sp. 411]
MEKIFDPNNPVHKERANLAKIGPSGAKMLDGVFEPLIEKDTTVATDFQKTFSFTRLYDDVPDTLAEFQESIFIWEGEGQIHWTDGDRGNLLPNIRLLCTLEANMSRLVPLLKLEKGEGGQSYCTISYEIVVEVGRTQLQARIQWRENVSVPHDH